MNIYIEWAHREREEKIMVGIMVDIPKHLYLC